MKKGGLAGIFSPMAKLAEQMGASSERLDVLIGLATDTLSVQEKDLLSIRTSNRIS